MDLLLWAPLGNADGVSAKTEKGVEDRAAAPQVHRYSRANTCESERLTRVILKIIHRRYPIEEDTVGFWALFVDDMLA